MRGWVRAAMSSTRGGAVVASYRHRLERQRPASEEPCWSARWPTARCAISRDQHSRKMTPDPPISKMAAQSS
jgi:hypothetical protein